MPTPTTVHQVEMLRRAFAENSDAFREVFQQRFILPIYDLMRKRLFLQRPYTDDMFQMLQDLGIEPPAEFNPVTFDGKTFRMCAP